MATADTGALVHSESLTPLDVLGVDFLPLESYAQAVAALEDRLRARQRTVVVAVNPEKVYRAWQDPEMSALVQRADVRICDGAGLAVVASLLHRRRVTRITGADLFDAMVARAAEAGWRVFLLGASEQVNAVAAAELSRRHPRLRLAGRHHGFFESSDEPCRAIDRSEADVVFVAMGSPRQERWMAEHAPRCHPAVWMGVGGTLDVLAGHAVRAPRWMRSIGVEFLYRLVTDPRRWRRQVALPLFMAEAARRSLVARWRGPGLASERSS